uniref:Uncharacterized protein n=1 Tax=Arundo donax TaxID=35708 RepID=A0A0A8YH01_ARUDO
MLAIVTLCPVLLLHGCVDIYLVWSVFVVTCTRYP